MTKRKGVQMLIGLLLVAALVLTPMACKAPEAPPVAPPVEAPPVAPPVEGPRFTLADIPEVENKRPVCIIVESEAGMRLMPPVFEAFLDHTGVDTTVDTVLFAAMYPKINVELIGGTGAYDIVIVESSSTNEWAPYLYSMEELDAMFNPGGMAALSKELGFFHPTLLRTCSTKDKVLMGMPYDSYTQCMMYRGDVWENPTEKANFKARYGYELLPPLDWRQLHDQAEFFTRKEGELLKGQPLEWDIYGMAFEAGKFNINDEISANMWGMGGYWAEVVRDEAAQVIGYRITEQNKLLLESTLEIMTSWLPYCPPGVLTYYWEHVATDFIAGRIMMTPHTFGCCIMPWASDVADVVPGARIAGAECIGHRGYVGCFHLAVPRASKNPEGAYWLVRLMTSGKYSLEWGVAGAWGSAQLPVLTNPQYYEYPRTALHLPWQNKCLDYHLPFVDNYIHFNSSAMGKLYEEQIVIGGDVMAGTLTPKEGMERWVSVLIELQTKFGALPILD